MSQDLKLGFYKHYKGKYYQVLGEGTHSETLEVLVFYRALYDDFGLWARPKAMFLGEIDVEGERKPRFQFVKTIEDELN